MIKFLTCDLPLFLDFELIQGLLAFSALFLFFSFVASKCRRWKIRIPTLRTNFVIFLSEGIKPLNQQINFNFARAP